MYLFLSHWNLPCAFHKRKELEHLNISKVILPRKFWLIISPVFNLSGLPLSVYFYSQGPIAHVSVHWMLPDSKNELLSDALNLFYPNFSGVGFFLLGRIYYLVKCEAAPWIVPAVNDLFWSKRLGQNFLCIWVGICFFQWYFTSYSHLFL